MCARVWPDFCRLPRPSRIGHAWNAKSRNIRAANFYQQVSKLNSPSMNKFSFFSWFFRTLSLTSSDSVGVSSNALSYYDVVACKTDDWKPTLRNLKHISVVGSEDEGLFDQKHSKFMFRASLTFAGALHKHKAPSKYYEFANNFIAVLECFPSMTAAETQFAIVYTKLC